MANALLHHLQHDRQKIKLAKYITPLEVAKELRDVLQAEASKLQKPTKAPEALKFQIS